jgi:MoaA/NifB/PqqE/SkfB family radical SAM enzyme
MQEWVNEYNSFNSAKGFLYKDWYDGIIKGEFKPPIEVNIDPVNNCNLFCKFCNAKNIINRKKEEIMPTDHMLKTIQFLADWGVKAVCFAGGGESVLHPDLDKAFIKCTQVGLKSALISNGLFLNDDQLETIARHARWIGISVDAGKPQTYKDLKGLDAFEKVTNNIQKIALLGTRELTYKFLIHPDNQFEIYDACIKAKQLGCHRFHARPLSFLNYQNKEDKYCIEEIEKQIALCHKLNNKNFEVITAFHKYDKDMHRAINFKKCLASPILAIFEANGDVNMCLDRKGDPKTILCSHYPNPEVVAQVWGSKRHKKLLNAIDPKKDCPKCTFNKYNEQIEAYRDDKLCWEFT